MATQSLPQSAETPQTYTIKEFQLLVRDKPAIPAEILPFALSLAPSTASDAGNVCHLASSGCSAVCLNYAGRGQMSSIQQARIQKTRFWFSDRDGFLALLTRDLEKVQRLARRQGKLAAVRLNVFSDIPWERFLDLHCFPDIQFYDYTKVVARLGRTPAHYDLTFSRSENNEPQARQALARGFNVAVPFRDPPARFMGHPVIDGDHHNYRFLDPRPVIVALKPKGLARDDTTGFVREDCPRYAPGPDREPPLTCPVWPLFLLMRMVVLKRNPRS